jgi:hypothetical protein
VFKSIAGNPGQVPELIRTLAKFSRGYSAFKTGAKTIPGRLAFDLR